MDQFMEEVVTKQKQGFQNVLYVLANISMVIMALIAVMLFNVIFSAIAQVGFDTSVIVYIVATLLMGGGAVLLYLRKDQLKTEYEYTFTNGTLDFAQVYNNKKRKGLGTMNVRNLEACGLVSSGSFQRYITMPGIKTTNWFLNREANLVYLYFVKDGKKRMIIMEPSDEMLTLIRRSLGQGVYPTN